MNKKRIFAILLALLLLLFAIAKFSNQPSGRIPDIRIEKKDGRFSLSVDGKPHLIRGVCYSPVPIGKDYEYNFWGAPEKPWLVDGPLMKDMGVNTVRFYKAGKNPAEVKQVVDELYKKFGIRTLMGNYLGFWNWPPPNYANAEFRNEVKRDVLEMVRLYKDSPGIFAWVLGNENNYSFDKELQKWSSDEIDALPDGEARRRKKAEFYYKFVNELAQEIKKIDPKHPVVMGVGEVASLDIAKEHCPDVDVIGMIAYRGPSFGNLFRQVKQKFDLPVLMIEYGADSFNALRRKPDERNQAEFLKQQWIDIERNTGVKGTGNVIGGVIFEWNDEWWKGNENLPHTWSVHEEAGHWSNPSYYFDAEVKDRLNMNEEWFGVVSLDENETEKGIDKRVPKKSYEVMKSLWSGK